jgi:hypothetical protein
MKLITESNFEVSIISEGQEENKSLYIEGIFSSAEKKNKNGRIYSKKILEREIEKLRDDIVNRSLIGELNHPNSPSIDLDRGAILIEDLSWEKNDIIGKAKVLNTPKGQIARNYIDDNVRIGISSRGLGTVNEQTSYVNEDFDLRTWDIVHNPSNHGSFVNGILEGVDFSITNYQEQLIEQAKKEYTQKI